MTKTTEQIVGETLGDRLRNLRESAGISLPTLAFRVWSRLPERYHIVPETIRRYEADAVKKPDLIVLMALAEVFGISLEDLSTEAAEDWDNIEDLRYKRSDSLRIRSRCYASAVA